jgi:hypothetical protein
MASLPDSLFISSLLQYVRLGLALAPSEERGTQMKKTWLPQATHTMSKMAENFSQSPLKEA